jgi:hypothetical protein
MRLHQLIKAQKIIRESAEQPNDILYPSIEEIEARIPDMVHAAQEVYDSWDQTDSDAPDGGIGIMISDEVFSILDRVYVRYSSDAHKFTTVPSIGGKHAYCVFVADDTIYKVDIPSHFYQTGQRPRIKKIQGVEFTSDMVQIYNIAPSSEWENYIK